jgi:hypothetical protein
MWDRLSTTAGAVRKQVGRLAEEALASAEEFSQQVRIWQVAFAAVLAHLLETRAVCTAAMLAAAA